MSQFKQYLRESLQQALNEDTTGMSGVRTAKFNTPMTSIGRSVGGGYREAEAGDIPPGMERDEDGNLVWPGVDPNDNVHGGRDQMEGDGWTYVPQVLIRDENGRVIGIIRPHYIKEVEGEDGPRYWHYRPHNKPGKRYVPSRQAPYQQGA